MKSMKLALAGTMLGTGLLVTGIVAPEPLEAAGPFDKLKKKVKKVKKKAEQVDEVVTEVDRAKRTKGRSLLGSSSRRTSSKSCFGNTRSSTSASACTAQKHKHAGRAPDPSAKLMANTQCSSLKLTNMQLGRFASYTYQRGMSTEKSQGFIDRQSFAPIKDCYLPGLGTGDTVVFEVDAAQYKAMGITTDWQWQCINSQTGKQTSSEAYHPHHNSVKGRAMLLYTNNEHGLPSAAGNNNARQKIYNAELKKRGKMLMSIEMPDYHMDKGTDFYCHYYNVPSGKSLVAFQYRRSAGG